MTEPADFNSLEALALGAINGRAVSNSEYRLAQAYLDALAQLRAGQGVPEDPAVLHIRTQFQTARQAGVFRPTGLAPTWAATQLREEGFVAGYKAALEGMQPQGWLACRQGHFPFHVMAEEDLPTDAHARVTPIYTMPEGLPE